MIGRADMAEVARDVAIIGFRVSIVSRIGKKMSDKIRIKLDWQDVPSGHKQRPSGMGPHKKQDKKREKDKLRRDIREQKDSV